MKQKSMLLKRDYDMKNIDHDYICIFMLLGDGGRMGKWHKKQMFELILYYFKHFNPTLG